MAAISHDSVQKLSVELIEKIFTELVDTYHDDPALQWVELRQLSAYQKRRIERHFRDFWLPKFVVTIYCGATTQLDYELVTVKKRPDSTSDNITHFSLGQAGRLDRMPSDYLPNLWKSYSFENRVAHLRLGESYLNGGLRAAYIVNDTGLPGLQVDESAKNIRFNWREALNELLREQMMLRNISPHVVSQCLRLVIRC